MKDPTGRAAPGAVVILGCAARPDGTPSPALEARLDVALRLARERPDWLLVPSGAAVANAVVEADAMARWLADRGVDPARIVPERDSRDTRDQAAFIAAWLDAAPLPLVVVAGEFQRPRARAYLTLLGAAERVEIVGAPRDRSWTDWRRRLTYELGVLFKDLMRWS